MLTGEKGIGKSALLKYLLHYIFQRKYYKDGIYY